MNKVLIFIIVSLLSFNTGNADSFNQITLQGMKIGESFLKYVDEKTIKDFNNPKYKNNKYSTSSFDLREAGSEHFDVLDISFMTSDRSYKIVEIGAVCPVKHKFSQGNRYSWKGQNDEETHDQGHPSEQGKSHHRHAWGPHVYDRGDEVEGCK